MGEFKPIRKRDRFRNDYWLVAGWRDDSPCLVYATGPTGGGRSRYRSERAAQARADELNAKDNANA